MPAALHRPEPVLRHRAEPVDQNVPLAQAAAWLCEGRSLIVTDRFGTGLDILAALRVKLEEPAEDAGYVKKRAFREAFQSACKHLLAPVVGRKVALAHAPRAGFLAELYPDHADFALPVEDAKVLSSAWDWYEQGVHFPVLGYRVHPFYGTYIPARMEHLELFGTWLAKYQGARDRAIDVGTGTGILALQLASESKTAERPTSVAFVSDSRLLYGGFSGSGALVEIRAPERRSPRSLDRELAILSTLHHDGAAFCAVAVARDGRTIATQSAGAPRLYRLPAAGGPPQRLGPITDTGNWIALTRGERSVWAVESTWTLVQFAILPTGELGQPTRHVFDFAAAARREPTFECAEGDKWIGFVLTPDERWLIAGTVSRAVFLFRFPALELVATMQVPQCKPTLNYPSRACAFAPDSSVAFLGLMDGSIRRWSFAAGGFDRTLAGGTKEVIALAVSPCGRWLASGDVLGVARLYDLEHGGDPAVLKSRDSAQVAHVAFLSGLDFSPDGRELATAGEIPPIAMQWDLATRQPIRVLSGHRSWVNGVMYSRDGRRLLTAANDGTVRLWDRATGRTLRIVRNDLWAGLAADDLSFWGTNDRDLIRHRMALDDPTDDPAESLRRAERAIGMRLRGLRLEAIDAPPR